MTTEEKEDTAAFSDKVMWAVFIGVTALFVFLSALSASGGKVAERSGAGPAGTASVGGSGVQDVDVTFVPIE